MFTSKHTGASVTLFISLLALFHGLYAHSAESWMEPNKHKDGELAKAKLGLADLFQRYSTHRSHRGFGDWRSRSVDPNGRERWAVIQRLIPIDAIASGGSETLLTKLELLGLQGGEIYGRTISGRIPIDAIGSMTRLDSLQFARLALATTRNGVVTSQGVRAMFVGDAQFSSASEGGDGVAVGVLSDSYDCYDRQGANPTAADDIASCDLPSQIIVLRELADCSSGTDEGRAMMQLIHDVAPDSEQLFHTAFEGQANFARGIRKLTEAGADIIVDDVIYFAEPMFQDGIIAQAAETAKAAGVVYLTAAGNAGRNSYEGRFKASGKGPQGDVNYDAHDFNPDRGVDIYQQITLPPGTGFTLSLQWDQPFFSVSGAPGSRNDIDILLLDDPPTTVLASSTDSNLGGDPVEVFAYSNPANSDQDTFNIAIAKFRPAGGPNPKLMKYILFSFYGNIDEYNTASATVFGHANTTGAIAVGASRYDQTPAFGVDPPILEPFSSAGSTPILFDKRGKAASRTPEKPDLVAPDGTNTTFFSKAVDLESDGFPNFFGTSAAAAHAAGTTALLRSCNPDLTPEEIQIALQDTAIDMDSPGFDENSGHGLIDASAAAAEVCNDSTNSASSEAKLEVGVARVKHRWQTVKLKNAFKEPIVVAKLASYNGDDPGVVRLRRIRQDSFQIRFQEWSNMDGRHTWETVTYLVVERGRHQLGNGQIEAGTVSFKNTLPGKARFVPIKFSSSFSTKPLVFSAVGTTNGGDAVTTRHRKVKSTGFEVIMQEEENGGWHRKETIYWIALQPGTGLAGNDIPFRATSVTGVTEDFRSLGLSREDTPCLLADLQTFNGPDTANLRYDNATGRNLRIKVTEETSKDREVKHIGEKVGFIAFNCTP